MDEQAPQIAVTSLADSHKPAPVTAWALSGHEAQPGCQLPAVFEAGGVAYGGYHGCSSQGSHSSDLTKPLAGWSLVIHSLYPLVVLLHPDFQIQQLLEEMQEQLSGEGSHAVFAILQDSWHLFLQSVNPLRDHDAVLSQQPPLSGWPWRSCL